MHRLYTRVSKGFTLYELLVVVTIIGLLTIIVVPNYLRARSKAISNTCASNQKIIYTAATVYMLEETEPLVEMGHKERLDALVNKGYLKGNKWAECPSGGDRDYDDYTIVFNGDIVADVECDINPSEHTWP